MVSGRLSMSASWCCRRVCCPSTWNSPICIYIYIYIHISRGWQPVVPPFLAYSMLKKVLSHAREYIL